MSKTSSMGGLVAGILGGAVFLVFFLLVDLPWPVALLVAAGASAAGFLLVPRARGETPGDPDLVDALAEGRKKLAGIRRLGRSIQDPQVTAAIEGIAGVADRILGEAGQDPRALKKARPFLTYYLDSTVKILDLYTGLKAQSLDDPEVSRTLGKVEVTLQTLRGAFEKLLARLLADDVLDLDTEISLLDQTIKMEGLGP